MSNSHDIGVLNTLISTTLDSVKGFRDAGEDSAGTHSAFFTEMASERSRVASEMQNRVRELGGDPEDESSTAGALHRGFLNLKEMITGKDDQAIINEVERGEDYIKSKFDAAMEDEDLLPETRGLLQQCYESIRKGHDRASAMKHANT
jgi:uncharacterized protein (TIGR02284 family)